MTELLLREALQDAQLCLCNGRQLVKAAVQHILLVTHMQTALLKHPDDACSFSSSALQCHPVCQPILCIQGIASIAKFNTALHRHCIASALHCNIGTYMLIDVWNCSRQ